ncbi:MAG: gliding motility-associated C-terminal domain-containing protein [Croceitalea sp.]|nr:gliding motility-associated C-terminal domain-containing protein [Croceitalea sp.]
MKRVYYILCMLATPLLWCQAGLYNLGNLHIHDQGNLGIHTNLINNGVFDTNTGLVGFYGEEPIVLSGAFEPRFFDVEFDNETGVLLRTNMQVKNNANFIYGNLITLRNLDISYLNFLSNAFYTGESNVSKVFGYAAVTDQQNFTFPIGDGAQLRTLTLNSSSINEFARATYFYENPSAPNSINATFSTLFKTRDIGSISNEEFWILRGDVSSNVTLSWNERSNIPLLTTDINELTLVGWNSGAGQWVILGKSAIGGDLTEGFITSDNFLPNTYGAITFASLAEAEEILELDNYFLSPNGDGINDFLVIEGMELSNDNTINIYNRQGQKVFEMDNYTNQFKGVSNLENFVLNREIGLPEGIYYYTVSLIDLGLNFQGFLFLDR